MRKQMAYWVRVVVAAMVVASVIVVLVEAVGLNLMSLAE
jgi:hypothetical protein